MGRTDKPAGAGAPTADRVATSRKVVEHSTGKVRREAKRRTMLAADRTLLSVERTYAAWVRTALAALASGVGARALLVEAVPSWLAKVTGSVLVIFAGFCLVAAVWRQLWTPVPPSRTDLKPLPHSALVPMNAFLLLVAAAALFGIWAA